MHPYMTCSDNRVPTNLWKDELIGIVNVDVVDAYVYGVLKMLVFRWESFLFSRSTCAASARRQQIWAWKIVALLSWGAPVPGLPSMSMSQPRRVLSVEAARASMISSCWMMMMHDFSSTRDTPYLVVMGEETIALLLLWAVSIDRGWGGLYVK